MLGGAKIRPRCETVDTDVKKVDEETQIRLGVEIARDVCGHTKPAVCWCPRGRRFSKMAEGGGRVHEEVECLLKGCKVLHVLLHTLLCW